MLQASHIQIKSGTTDPIIAGNSSGRRVHCSPQAIGPYNNLIKLSNSGNYWANLVVKTLSGLCSGKLHKNNIFVKKETQANGDPIFHVVLPGITATLETHTNGICKLTYLQADDNYQKLQAESKKPGLWRASRLEDVLPFHQGDGMIKNKIYRPVFITDMSTDDVQKTSQAARDNLISLNGTIENIVSSEGFDMHHTPAPPGEFIGHKNTKKALSTSEDKEIVRSAVLLANTMYQASNIEGILWYSNLGGSAILSRAMEILINQKDIKLDKHAIFLNRPISSPKHAIQLASKLRIAVQH